MVTKFQSIAALGIAAVALGMVCGSALPQEPAAIHQTRGSEAASVAATVSAAETTADDASTTKPATPEVAPNLPASPRRPLRVAVISDLNSGYGSKSYGPAVHAATEALVNGIAPDLVLITGDMVAGQKKGLDYRGMWKAFHASVTDPLLAAHIPVAPAPGNHDAAPGFEVERSRYVEEWTDPAHTARVTYRDDSHYPLYYSFELGGVFFAAVDATAVGPLRGEQHAWLDGQLSDNETEVTIVFGHLPNHPFAKKREREILDDPEFEEMLGKYEVDAYVSGHHHAYYPGAVDGVRHVAMPCLGGGRRKLLGSESRSSAALLVVEIDDRWGITSLEAFSAPDFDEPVPRRTLPRKIRLGHHAVVRDDLDGEIVNASPSASR